MSVARVADRIFLIDVETAGLKGFIASYVLKGKSVAIVETGPTSSIPNLLSGLKKLNVKPEDVAYVAVSHIHLDHCGGVGTLVKHLPNAKVVVHSRGAPHLVEPGKLWEQSKAVLGSITDLYGPPEPVPKEKIVAASDGMSFSLGDNLELRVAETTGHASHHQSYYEASNGGLFPGDAAGIYLNEIDVIVPTTPAPFRLDIALGSLEKLMNLKPKLLFYSHFGKADGAVDKLRRYVDQLNLWARIAKQGIENKESLAEICDRIVVSDEAVRKVQELIKAHAVLSKTVLDQSVQGVVEFVRSSGFRS